MTEGDYLAIQKRIKESGLTQQAYMINASKYGTIPSSDEIDVLVEISNTFSSLIDQLRGIATNVNQLARVANSQRNLPIVNVLMGIYKEVSMYRRESNELWRLIRLSTNQRKHMEQ